MSNRPIPDSALDDRHGFVGTSGSGKTYGAGVCVEHLLDRKDRVIIPDALGVWWGVRLLADGKTPSPWDVVIFGGPHGDLPINEHSGALIGETVAGMKESAILDLSEIGSKAGERRFMLAFLTALYRKSSGEPVHVIFDEADMWAPQHVRDKDGEAAKLLGMMETIVRRGRVKGFIPWLITQRPAVVNKDVLSQVDGLVAFKLTSTQDRDALGNWVEGQADKDEWKRMRAELPTLDRGKAVVWLPGHGVLKTTTFPAKRSFDSSSTPKRGEKKRSAALKPLNLEALKGRLATVQAEAEANDPKHLKTKIAQLERDLAKKAPAAIDPKVTAEAEARAEERGKRLGVEEGIRIGEAKGKESAISRAIGALQGILGNSSHATTAQVHARGAGSDAPTRPPHATTRPVSAPIAYTRHETRERTKPASGNGSGSGGDLPVGERTCLIAIAQYDAGVRREQLTVLTGYKKSSRDTYIQRLRQREFVEQRGDRVVATDAGVAALGDSYDPLPTGAELQARVLRELPEGECKILKLAIDFYPDAVDRDAISDATGYKKSSRDTYLQRLSRRELIETVGRGEIRASANLFD